MNQLFHPFTRVGADEPNAAPTETLSQALRRITPSMFLIGIVTGAAFAIGSGLVSRYVFSRR